MGQVQHADWESVQVAGKTCDVYEPARSSSFLLIFLHGVGMETLNSNAVWTRLLATHGLLTLCPHGKRSWWTNRICSEFDPEISAEQHILRNVLPYARERWGIEPPRIGLAGISMGGQGALRLAMKHPAKFPVVAGIASALDYQILHGQGTTIDEMYDDAETARQDTALLYVHPLNWPRNMLFVVDPADRTWFDGNQRLHEKLAALGIPHQFDLTTSAGGHSWEYFNFMAPRVIEFILRGLESEQMRAGNV
jgi:poly(3-hydroxybutyrate) depolymerase